MARYSVNNYTVDVLLADIKSGNIAIPEMQRPFVWDATQVRDLMDSLYKGFPVGYIIVWQNPSVKLKDGTVAIGKKVLIDGQQRITAMAAAIVGQEVLDSHYKWKRVCIAFNPIVLLSKTQWTLRYHLYAVSSNFKIILSFCFVRCQDVSFLLWSNCGQPTLTNDHSPLLSYMAQFRFSKIEIALFCLHELFIRRICQPCQ